MKRVLHSKKRLGSRVPGFGEKASLRDTAAPTCAGILVMQGPPLQVRNSGPGHGDLHCCAVPWAVLIQTGAAILDCHRVFTQVPRDRFDERYERNNRLDTFNRAGVLG